MKFIKENWFKISILIVIILVVVYYFVSYLPEKNNFVIQERCSVQAKEVSNTFQSKTLDIGNYNYQNHYNNSLGKCYVLLHGTGAGGASDVLMNAYENKSVIDCESYVTSPDLNYCNYNGSNEGYNINKFNISIKSYMETN